jgi:hypothetical protein
MHMGPNRNSDIGKVKGNPHWTREFDEAASSGRKCCKILHTCTNVGCA